MTAPITASPLAFPSTDFFEQRMHFFQAGFRWVERWTAAVSGSGNPIQALLNRGAMLAAARKIMLVTNASINGMTIAYVGSGGFKHKAFTSHNPSDGIGPGLFTPVPAANYEPTFMALGLNLYDASYAIREERDLRGLASTTANHFPPSGVKSPGSPELDALAAMIPILSANGYVDPATGMQVQYGIRSSQFSPANSITPEPVTMSCLTSGNLVITTQPGQVLNCGPPNIPIPATVGTSVKLRGNRSNCFKGINGVTRILNININVDGSESYTLTKQSCCGCAALACWTGNVWCKPDFLWQYQSDTYPDFSGVGKRSTGVTGLGTRRGRRRNRCCRPAPATF